MIDNIIRFKKIFNIQKRSFKFIKDSMEYYYILFKNLFFQ